MNKKIMAIIALGITSASIVATSALANASPEKGPHLTADGYGCTYTPTEYLTHAGGASTFIYPGTTKFSATFIKGSGMDDPYITSGYNQSVNSQMCNSRGGHSLSVPVPVNNMGRYVDTSKYTTSSSFKGDTGLDMWFAPSKSDNTYAKMTNGGDSTTEIMVWDSHPKLGTQSTNLRYYPVNIGGHRWQVGVGLASNGHGKEKSRPNGWTVVNFIAPDIKTGTTSVNGLYVNPLVSYAMSHGWLKRSDYLMGSDSGGEMWSGSLAVDSYSANGLK